MSRPPFSVEQRVNGEPPSRSGTIDYLARDYHGFRRLMLDRIAARLPGWDIGDTPDLGSIIVDILAHAGDRLSYYQDAVAAEAYLTTARERISIRRHARLLDYSMHEGCAARAWLRFDVAASVTLRSGFAVSSDGLNSGASDQPHEGGGPVDAFIGKTVFETLTDAILRPEKATLAIHDFDKADFFIPKGATSCALRASPGAKQLQAGEVVIFAATLDTEVKDPNSGGPAPASITMRHPVRLDRPPQIIIDEESGEELIHISWHRADRMPFDLPVSTRGSTDNSIYILAEMWGNIVPADCGLSVMENKPLEFDFHADGSITARLRLGAPSWVVPYIAANEKSAPASKFLRHRPQDSIPALTLVETKADGTQAIWTAHRDLLSCDRFSRAFAVECDNDGHAVLRFGDNVHGWKPSPNSVFTARYRIGASNGNVATDTLRQWHGRVGDEAVTAVNNPVPAAGGCSPESLDQVRRNAPAIHEEQLRCVSSADYQDRFMRLSGVRAVVPGASTVAKRMTYIFHVDRKGSAPCDAAFLSSLKGELEPFRILGGDVFLFPPNYVPLAIDIEIDCLPGHAGPWLCRNVIKSAYSRCRPDVMGFGQPFFMSFIVETVMAVPGVADMRIKRFCRLDGHGGDRRNEGCIEAGPTEILRLDDQALDGCGGELTVTAGTS